MKSHCISYSWKCCYFTIYLAEESSQNEILLIMAPKDFLHKRFRITVARTMPDNRGNALLHPGSLLTNQVSRYNPSTSTKSGIPLPLLNNIYIIFVTHDRLDDGRTVAHVPAGATYSSLLQKVQVARPAYYSMVIGGCFPEGQLKA
jgi:hypothetical protein